MTSDTPTPRTDAVYEQNKAHWSEDMMTPFARQLEIENRILRNGMEQILQGVFKPKMIATRVMYHLERMEEEGR